jgi:hypothetical protein
LIPPPSINAKNKTWAKNGAFRLFVNCNFATLFVFDRNIPLAFLFHRVADSRIISSPAASDDEEI